MSCIGIHIKRIDCFTASARRVDAMSVNVSVICDIDTGRYLIVSPTFLWVTDWDSEITDVKSNTDWKVD